MDYQNKQKINLSKNKTKFINSLKIKKYRDEHNCFIAEGNKLVIELLKSNFKIVTLIGTNLWFQSSENQFNLTKIELIEATIDEMQKISELTNTQEVIAIVEIPEFNFDPKICYNQLVLALDNIQNPGNMGTILRIADWFGIENIICSPSCADLFNPKVIQATMGALTRLNIVYTDLAKIFKYCKINNIPVYGTYLEGNSIYNQQLSNNGIIVMGNEGQGISSEIRGFITSKIFIPGYPANEIRGESLNVATACAIVCYEFRRQNMEK